MNQNPGLYYVTICTKYRQHHFGEIRDGIMGLSVPGCVAWYFWRDLPNHHPNVVLDEFIIMPNHLHGIVGITPKNDNESLPKPVGTLCATSLQNDTNKQNDDSPEHFHRSMLHLTRKSTGQLSGLYLNFHRSL